MENELTWSWVEHITVCKQKLRRDIAPELQNGTESQGSIATEQLVLTPVLPPKYIYTHKSQMAQLIREEAGLYSLELTECAAKHALTEYR
jgi:hypothetical protein